MNIYIAKSSILVITKDILPLYNGSITNLLYLYLYLNLNSYFYLLIF